MYVDEGDGAPLLANTTSLSILVISRTAIQVYLEQATDRPREDAYRSAPMICCCCFLFFFFPLFAQTISSACHSSLLRWIGWAMIRLVIIITARSLAFSPQKWSSNSSGVSVFSLLL